MKDKTLFRVLSYTKPYLKYLIIALLCALISTGSMLYVPILIGNAVDEIIGINDVNFNNLLPILLKLVITVLVYGLFYWLMNLAMNVLSHRTIKDMRMSLFKHLENMSLKYLDKTSHGDLIVRIVSDIDKISDGLIQGFSQLFTGIITILGTLIFMFILSSKLTLVVILITPISLFVAYFVANHSHKMFREQLKYAGILGGYLQEAIVNQKMIKAYNYEEESIKKFSDINNELNKWGFKAQWYSSLTNPSTRFVNSLVYASVGIIGALMVINSKNNVASGLTDVLAFTIGNLSCFLIYANQYTKPFNEISGVISELQTAFGCARRVFSVLDEETEVDDSNNVILHNVDGSLSFENVSFSYDKEKKLIENFNLKVQPSMRIAIVGPTGCGKTTLINLLMRFYDVDSGKIKISNYDVKELKRQSVRRSYGMVLQDTWLFKGTIKENIAYGRDDATDEEIIMAAKAAHIHNFIMRLPNGYNTIIANDSDISEGQRQLLCIARVMLVASPMLILDEATSNIDTLTEIKIQKAFKQMMKNKTSFIIAHRLSTIINSDLILVMSSGKIIEQGNHQELLAKKGFYYNLYQSQFVK